MTVINATPFEWNIFGSGPVSAGPVFTYPASGKVARIIVTELGTSQGPEIWYESIGYGEIEEIPEPEDGTYYIVSLAVALAGRRRGDLFAPYKKLYDTDGKLLGCRYLQKVI